MTDTSQPSDVARETLRQLALRRIAPTPDNYRALYHEIAGSAAEDIFPERALKQIAAALPRHNHESLRLARDFETAVAASDWNALRSVVTEGFTRTEQLSFNWGSLLRDLITEWDRRQSGLTQARKQDMLDRVLAASGGNPDKLHERLQGLLRAWSRNGDEEQLGSAPLPADNTDAPTVAIATPQSARAPESNGALAEMLAALLASLAGQLRATDPELASEADALATILRANPEPTAVRERLDRLRAGLDWAAEDHLALREALERVLHLILENISELVIDDRWLHGQITLMGEMFDQPLDVRVLGELESRLRDVITPGRHQDRAWRRAGTAEGNACPLRRPPGRLLRIHRRLPRQDREVRRAHRRRCRHHRTHRRHCRSDARDPHGPGIHPPLPQQIQELQARVHDANHEISRLQVELEQTSELIRHDPLTGVLNRKGLDEALARDGPRPTPRNRPVPGPARRGQLQADQRQPRPPDR
jgi:diguanylate cyclase